ncbi:MAG: CmcJ/NvfI family oxidoreductase [Rhodospirillaceae bacterium]|nr:CmcJ/NvfI family oxidoreductase [Rhodospirillaceae bacterium]MDE0616513.1 CmcJ/NvfI family oxidoreductase [Rhodospirillaceae bacterium]
MKLSNPGLETTDSAGDVEAPLTFIVRQNGTPCFLSSALTGGPPEYRFRTEPRSVTIHDVRSESDRLSVEREGFELVRHRTEVDDLYDDEAVAGPYSREVEALLCETTGASRAIAFDHTRRSDATDGAANPDGSRGPARIVHVDYTEASGPVRAADVLGKETVDRILGTGGRIAEVNVWRPIAGPVQRSPLAVADARSVDRNDLIATEQKFPDRTGEIYMIAHAPEQRWCWVSGMTRDETLLLKGWDSLDDGRARFTPHGSFTLPDQDPEAPPRESIETRVYLVFDEQEPGTGRL